MKTATTAQRLIIELPNHKSDFVGFFHSGGSSDIRGCWSRLNGAEGGELWIDATNNEVSDFDGDYDLPDHVRAELESLNINVNF